MVAISQKAEMHFAARESLFTSLYNLAFPRVAKFVSKRQGTFQDAKDIFQDALVIFYEKMNDGKLSVHHSSEAYLVGIAKHLWIKKYHHDEAFVSLNSFESTIDIPDDFYPTTESLKLITVLEKAGKRCMELLQAFYYEKLSISAITASFGFGSTHSAAVQKFKCLEKVRDTIKEKSLHYEDFTG